MYQTRQKRCRKCKRETLHWRDLPDMPRYWSEEPGLIPYVLWARVVTRWKCRGCFGVPSGPLEIGTRQKKTKSEGRP